MHKRLKILALLGLWAAAALYPAARADGQLNTTRPARPQQSAPAAPSNYVYGAGTVYAPGAQRNPAGTYRDERRQYGAGGNPNRRYAPPASSGRRDHGARDRAVIEYSRDGGRDGYLIYRRNLERGDGYRDDGRRYDDRRDYDDHPYPARDSYRRGRERDSRHGRDQESCLGSHCYDKSSSMDGNRDKDPRQE